MLWFWCSLLAAALWGMNYAAAEHGLKSGISAYAQLAFIFWFTMPIFTFIAYKNGAEVKLCADERQPASDRMGHADDIVLHVRQYIHVCRH